MRTPRLPAASDRGLALGVGACSLGAAALHAAAPAWPFPMRGALFALGGLIALLSAAVPAGPWRRICALACWGALLAGGLPAAHHATFPWIELAVRTPEMLDLTLFSLVALRLSAPSPAAPPAAGTARIAQLGLLLLGLVGLAVADLMPSKLLLHTLAPPLAGQTPSPVLGWAAPGMLRWARINAEGSAWLHFPAVLRAEWTLMELAGGIHQQAGGSGLHQLVRFVETRLLEWIVAVAQLSHLAALPAAAVAALTSLTSRSGLGLRPGPAAATTAALSRGVLRVALLLVPCANLCAAALATLVWLPDDAALRPWAAGSAAFTLLCALWIERCAPREGPTA